MTRTKIFLYGGQIFDGVTLHSNKAACFEDNHFTGLVDPTHVRSSDAVVDLEGDILSPGYVDLQVNGGGGIMFNDDPSAKTLARIAKAHHDLGATRILPTLITDLAEKTNAAIDAARSAIANRTPGIAGLHLEGPHLSIARKGAHDAQFIRPMGETDLQILLNAKATLPILKVTIAPENVTVDQVKTLSNAGVLVSLGHTDADFDTCMAYAQAGARCVTHLFNAMSQLGNRTPGLVGAALADGALSAGMIADGVHVHPSVMRTAWAAKSGPGRIYLISDAMAVAGTDLQSFTLDGRTITRHNGQLRLNDGTLAGADLDLTTAIRILVQDVGIQPDHALAATTQIPASVCGLDARLRAGVTHISDIIRIKGDLSTASPLTGSLD